MKRLKIDFNNYIFPIHAVNEGANLYMATSGVNPKKD